MKKKLIISFSLFLIVQIFTSKELTNYQTTAEIILPDSILVLIKTHCYDCHSGETNYPLVSNLVPFNWLIHMNVEDGRHVIDFSKWENYNEFEQNYKMIAILKELEAERMPPSVYLFFDSDKILNANERQQLVSFFEKNGNHSKLK